MRKVYILPNIVTSANLFCGFYSIISSIHKDYEGAAWAILAATIFDMLDGRVARLAKATTRFGIEYDSLSDLVSFGVAPAVLLYEWALSPFARLGWLGAFLFMICGALRLARFNVSTSIIPKNFFQGLPIPIAAAMVATYVHFSRALNWPPNDTSLFSRDNFLLLITFGLASLMVSSIAFPSFKGWNWRSKASFGYLMVGILSMILIAVRPEVTMFLILSLYVVASLIWNLARILMKKPLPIHTQEESHKPHD